MKGQSKATAEKQSHLWLVLTTWVKVIGGINRRKNDHFGGFVIDCFAGDGESDSISGSPSSPQIISEVCTDACIPYGFIEAAKGCHRKLTAKYPGAAFIKHARWEDVIDDSITEMQRQTGKPGGLIYIDPNGPFDAMQLAQTLDMRKCQRVDCLINVSATSCKRTRTVHGQECIENSVRWIKKGCCLIREFSTCCSYQQWTMLWFSNWIPKTLWKRWHDINSPVGRYILEKAIKTQTDLQANTIQLDLIK